MGVPIREKRRSPSSAGSSSSVLAPRLLLMGDSLSLLLLLLPLLLLSGKETVTVVSVEGFKATVATLPQRQHLSPSSPPQRSTNTAFVRERCLGWSGRRGTARRKDRIPDVMLMPQSPISTTVTLLARSDSDGDDEVSSSSSKSPLDFLLNPYETKIPVEIRDDIYRAEGNTEAAKDRAQRVALYSVAAFAGILAGFFNGFLTELRSSTSPDTGLPFDLTTSAFAWVNSNPLFQFLLLNKIGGVICLLIGGGAGLLAEAEFDTRRINAEKIYEELLRRRGEKVNKSRRRGDGQKANKKRRSGKESKRLGALSEVASAETSTAEMGGTEDTAVEASKKATKRDNEEGIQLEEEGDNDGGIIGTVKKFYEKADKMAQTQALLLNKELEDKGLIDKITDESGFKVIGKDAADDLRRKQQQQDDEKGEEN